MTAPGPQSRLREINDRAALALLIEYGRLTRQRLCELTGLSRPTASRIMARLESIDAVYVAGEASAGRGPNAASYSVRADRHLAVALNLDRGLVQATVVDVLGTEHPVVESALPLSASMRDPVAEVSTAVETACAASGLDSSNVSMVCLGIRGAVDRRADELRFVADLPGWPRKGLRALLEQSLGYQVVIENDVNLAAVAERNLGAGQGAESFALLWLGAGLGSAVDIGGVLLRGASGRAGEIESLTVPRWAIDLDPDAHDLQSLAGGPALTRISRSFGLNERRFPSLVSALETHPARQDILSAMAPRVAAAAAALLAVVDPDRVVLGGPLATCGGESFARSVQAAIRRDSRWVPEIVTTRVTDHPVLAGARECLATAVRTAFLDEASTDLPGSSPVTHRKK